MKFCVIYSRPPTTQIVRFVSSSRAPQELAGSIVTWTANMFAAWRTPPCALTLTTCCILSAGGEVRHTATFGRRPYRVHAPGLCALPVRPTTATFPSIINDRVAVADRAIRMSFPMLPARSPAAFITPSCSESPWALAGARSDEPAAREGPKRNIVPLSVNEVARFWSSFRTARDWPSWTDAFARATVRRSIGFESGRRVAFRSPASRSWQGNKFRFLPLRRKPCNCSTLLRLERPDSPPPAVRLPQRTHA